MTDRRNNPILRVATNDQDYRQPEGAMGGGVKEIVEVTQDLRDNLSEQITGVKAAFQDNFNQWPELPCVAKLTLREKALAKSHRPGYLLDRAKTPLIGAAGIGQLLLSVTPDTLDALNDQVVNNITKSGRANISAIEDLSVYGRTDRLGGAGGWDLLDLFEWLKSGHPLKAELFLHKSDRINFNLEEQFLNWAAELSIDVKLEDYLTSAKLFSLTTRNLDSLENVLDFPGLRSLSPMPIYSSKVIGTQSIVGEASPHACSPPDQEKDYPLVGIIDSGVEPDHALLSPWIYAREEYVTPPDTDYSHGTFVGGLIVNSRELNLNAIEFPDLSAKLVDVAALSTICVNEVDLKARILEAVNNHPEVKVWNLSLGGFIPGPTDRFSDFAQMLDVLSDTTGCLFVIASGNYSSPPLRAMPPQDHIGDDDRISIPADSVRGLTVGSVAHLAVEQSAVQAGEPSPFSRRGPGPASIPKPELTHCGGNCSLTGDYTYTAVRSLLPDNKIGENIGTSFSTPLVALLAAHTWDEVEKNGGASSPELIKALLIHSAVLKSPPRDGLSLHYHGFGHPGEVLDTLYCDSNTFTLMFEADILDGLEFEKVPFPIPDCLRTSEGRFRGEIVVTLCYSPPLDGRYGAEYCRTNIDVSFGSYDFDKEGVRRHKGLVPLEPGDKNELYESKLVEHGFKWSPVKVYRKTFPRGVKVQDWRLKLKALRRSGEEAPDYPERAFVILSFRSLEDSPVYTDGVRALTRAGWVSNAVTQPIQVNA